MTGERSVPDVTYALAASPGYAQDGVCWAACQSGLYRSGDGGRTWKSAYDSLDLVAPLATSAVAVSPDSTSPGIVFAGIAGGVLRSPDGGDSWLTAELPPPPPLVSALALSPNYADDGVVLASTVEDGVFRSGDRGSSWTAWNFGLLDLNAFCMALSPGFAGDDTLYVGTESGIFFSTNGGRAWQESVFPMDHAPVLSLAISPGYAHDGCLFAGTEAKGLFRSDDCGHTWQRVGRVAIAGAVNAVVLAPRFPAQPDILVLAGDTLLVSHDEGIAWTEWETQNKLEASIVCVIAPEGLGPGAHLLAGLDDGRIARL